MDGSSHARYYSSMKNTEISAAARAMAMKRHLSLSPERRREIATKASKAAAKARKKKLSTPED